MTKILIADDESNILTLLKIMLRDLNATIFSAENGEEAINIAQKEIPDLIISDIVMPKSNGFEVCKTIRSNDKTKNIPIILLSALGDEYNKLTGFDEGADDYMIKPFNIEELKARAKKLLNRHQNKQTNNNVSRETHHCSTGATELDHHLGGGLQKGSNILILGQTGSGKSSFCRQFIAQGLEEKTKNLIITVDDNPNKIRKELEKTTGYETQTFEKNKNLQFVDAYSWTAINSTEQEKYAISGSLELNQLSGLIADAGSEIGQSAQEQKGGRRIIDSITSLLINFDIGPAQRFLTQITRTAQSFGDITTLFTLEEGAVDKQTLNNVKYIMDGIIEFKKENDTRYCKASSMKWTKTNDSWITIKQP